MSEYRAACSRPMPCATARSSRASSSIPAGGWRRWWSRRWGC